MVIARDQITLSWQLDVQGTVYYYKKQSSTATAPEKPTSYPPTGWTTTEPGYSSGETSTLYVTVCTLYDNGSFEYSDVSVSASFEAAKEAYNKAVAAQTAANNAITAANGKTKIFYQDDAPTAGMAVGDMWFDTDGGNAIYQYTATGWVLRQFGNGSIAAGSITANEIAANTITANKIAGKTITGAQIAGTTLSGIFADIGTITAGVLRSSDYSYSSGNYTTAGMIIDLNNKIIRTPKTAILADGSIYSSSVDLEGKIIATSGKIGGWEIDDNSLLYDKTEPITGGTLRQYTELDYFAVSGFSGKNAGTYEQSGYALYSSGVAEIYTIDTSVDYAPRLDVYQRFGTRKRGTEVNAGGVYFYDVGGTTEYSFTLTKDVKNTVINITRSGTTFTATRLDGTTFTFTQQDNNSVTGVKGNAETSYRTGNVNLTPANIGALALTGGTLSGNITFSATTDNGIIKGHNGTTVYNILRNHGNGNVSLSACGVGVYIGYENTTLINFNNGKVTIPNNGDLNVTVGNIYVGQASSTTLQAVIVRNSLGNAQLHVGASGNHGLYSSTKGNWIIYCNPDANSTNSWAYVPRPLYVTGNFVSTGEVHAGGKGTGSDGKAGSILSTAGHLYMQGASGSNIYFFYGTSTTVTSKLYESASGTLTASANFVTTGNLTVSTSSTSVDRTVTVSNGNASGSVRAASGGAFGLYVTKTGGVTRTAVYLTAMDSNGTYRTNWNPSDRRVKNIIGDMPDSEAETLLKRLKIYNFSYKTDATKTVQNGMIAQQVRDVLSECGYGYRLYLDIRSADGEDFLYNLNTPEQDVQYGIDYARMTPILWKGWQLHDGKILNHEDRIATLERENNRLKKEIELLKGDVA